MLAVLLACVALAAVLIGYTAEKVTHPQSSGASTPTATAPVSRLTGLTASQVAVKLAAAGLPLRTMQDYTASTDPNQLLGTPDGYTSKTSFLDGRTGVNPATALTGSKDPIDQGGGIEVFADPAAASSRLEQLRTLSTSAGQLLEEYDSRQGDVVLRISRFLTQQDIAAYQNAFAALGAPTSPTATG